ncbi:MAG: peptide-methionine (R)-S-oxide reductase MsrB [Bacteroidota bacterium]
MYLKLLFIFLMLVNFGIHSCSQSVDKEISNKKTKMDKKKKQDKSNNEWKKVLTPVQFYITRQNGTEKPFSGEYDHFFEKGIYKCICCGTELFESNTKFDSGCGWPSFYDMKDNKNTKLIKDNSLGMCKIEIRCAHCDAHLGHVFKDGPQPTGLRYCINSVSLKFEADSLKTNNNE